MSRKLFGTDGVRGTANIHPMTAEMALRLGAAAGRYFRRDGSAAHRVVIGKDTRLSGYMFENALTAGFTSTGMNVFLDLTSLIFLVIAVVIFWRLRSVLGTRTGNEKPPVEQKQFRMSLPGPTLRSQARLSRCS